MYKRKDTKGSISVFLALTITIMMSFCLVLIESARENTMLLKADILFDTGVNSIMAEYHQDLWEKYDLLYVDCSYAQEEPSYDKTLFHLANYVEKNLDFSEGNWLKLTYEDAVMGDVLLATDAEGLDFYRQAAAVSERNIGITYIQDFIDWYKQAESTKNLKNDMDEKKDTLSTAIEEANGTKVEVKPAVWGEDKEGNPILLEEAEYDTIDIDNPLSNILSANIILRQIVPDYNSVSAAAADISSLASNRTLAKGNANIIREESGIWDKALFCNYVFSHFNTYADINSGEKNDFFCEAEYLLGGQDSDAKNLEVAAAQLLLLREIDNYLFLLQDEVKQIEAHSIAAAATGLAPWLEPVVYQATMIYWAYEESITDLKTLFYGGEIPLVKTFSQGKTSNILLNYEEYLFILLMMQNKEVLTVRTIDLIELHIRKSQNTFRMDGCISKAVFVGTFSDAYEKKYTIEKALKY